MFTLLDTQSYVTGLKDDSVTQGSTVKMLTQETWYYWMSGFIEMCALTLLHTDYSCNVYALMVPKRWAEFIDIWSPPTEWQGFHPVLFIKE